ncbi:MAG: HAD-IA family hydrolase [Acidobacteriota bacterium]
MSFNQTVLFDLDGTLIDTTNLILKCFDHSWQSVVGRVPSRERLLETFGIPLREAMRRLLAHANGDVSDSVGDEIIDRLLFEYRSFNVANHDLLARPFDGAQETISALRARHYRIGVVTSKSRELALRGLKLCRLDALIDAAVFLEDTSRHKPDPEPICLALERLNAQPQQSAYVGDSLHDIEAGRRAGVLTVAALWGPAPSGALEAVGPDHLAASFHHLLEIFD